MNATAGAACELRCGACGRLLGNLQNLQPDARSEATVQMACQKCKLLNRFAVSDGKRVWLESGAENVMRRARRER